jgi:hypothetical protein
MTDAEALSRRLAGRTALAWVVGVVLLAALAIGMAHRGFAADLQAALRGHALAVYGLGYFEDDGSYVTRFIEMEPELTDSDVVISVVTDAGPVWGPHSLPGRPPWLPWEIHQLEPPLQLPRNGSTRPLPAVRVSKCRWGPVRYPELPTSPRRVPQRTRCPVDTATDHFSRWAQYVTVPSSCRILT